MVGESRRYPGTGMLPMEISRGINLQRLDSPLAFRYIVHAFVLILAVSVVLTNTISAQNKTQVDGSFVAPTSLFERLNVFSSSEYLQKPPQPVASGATNGSTTGRVDIITYEVVAGDTIYDIAAKYGVSIDSIIGSNKLDDADSIGIGDRLLIPPISGVIYTVQAGDTVAGIASKYKVDVSAITGYTQNKMTEPYNLTAGQKVMVPGGEIEQTLRPAPVARSSDRVSSAPSTARRGASGFGWPTTGPIFTYFSYYHQGLDISPSYGTPIYAAADGVILETPKLTWSYGWHVIMDNGGGYTTLYGHMSQFAVVPGQSVKRGQLIGYVGSTGKSTGPHLHFEIRVNGVAQDPLRYLP